MLLITADQDELFPPSHYQTLTSKVESINWTRIPDADHVFSTARKQPVHMTVGWLLDTLGA